MDFSADNSFSAVQNLVFELQNQNFDEVIILRIESCEKDDVSIECRLEYLFDLFTTYWNVVSQSPSKCHIMNVTTSAIAQYLNNVLDKISTLLNSKSVKTTSDTEKELVGNIQYCVKILETLTLLLKQLISEEHIEFYNIDALTRNISLIILNMFLHCKNSESVYASYFQKSGPHITNAFKKCHDLQCLYFVFIDTKMIFDLTQSSEMNSLIDVLDLMVQVGDVVASLDVKSMAEQWKGYSKICEKNVDYLKGNYCHEKAIRFLCVEIRKNLEQLMANESLDVKNDTRSLKISNFLLKILIKLSELFPDDLTTDAKCLVDLLSSIYQYCPSCLVYRKVKPTLIEGIRSHINVAADPLLLNLISNHEFQQDIVKCLKVCEDNRLGHLLLCVNIIKTLVHVNQETRNIWMNESNSNIMCSLLQLLAQCNMELTQNMQFECASWGNISLYDVALLHTATLAISCEDLSIVENKMLSCLLDTNLWSAVFCLDLWTIIARYGSAELRFEYTSYLFTMYDKLIKSGFLDNTPQKVYISILLQRLFQLLSNRMKNDLVVQFPILNYPEAWQAVNLDSLPKEQRTIEMEKALHKVSVDLPLFLNGQKSSVYDYGKLNEVLLLLPFISEQDYAQKNNNMKLDSIVDNVLEAWACLASDKMEKYYCGKESSIQGSQWLIKHVFTLSRIICSLSSLLSNHQWITVTSIMAIILEKRCQSTIKITTLEMLKCLLFLTLKADENKAVLSRIIAQLFKDLLQDENSVIQVLTMEAFAYIARITSNNEVISLTVAGESVLKQKINNFLTRKISHQEKVDPNYLNTLFKHEFIHKCEISQIDTEDHTNFDIGEISDIFEDDNEASPSKQIKVCNFDSDFSVAVEDLKKKALVLSELCSYNCLNELQKEQLISVQETLHTLITK